MELLVIVVKLALNTILSKINANGIVKAKKGNIGVKFINSINITKDNST